MKKYYIINIYIILYQLHRDDDGLSYILVGIVNGNPAGCGISREYPDYFTYVANTEVSFPQ